MERFLPLPVPDVAPAAWVVERMPAFTGVVADLVPGPFAAHARVFHRPDGGRSYEGSITPGSWAAVAEAARTTFHPTAQWSDLAGPLERTTAALTPHLSIDSPALGSLDRVSFPALAEVLARHTTTPDPWWLALWVGCGDLPPGWDGAATFHTPGRQHWLFRASAATLQAHAVAFEAAGWADDDTSLRHRLAYGNLRSPQLWWPEDRAWAVASEIDHDSTIVAGTHALVADLLVTPGLECLRISPRDSLMAGADRVNAL